MFGKFLPVTYRPLRGKHGCSLCSVALMKDYPLMFSINGENIRGLRRRRRQRGKEGADKATCRSAGAGPPTGPKGGGSVLDWPMTGRRGNASQAPHKSPRPVRGSAWSSPRGRGGGGCMSAAGQPKKEKYSRLKEALTFVLRCFLESCYRAE